MKVAVTPIRVVCNDTLNLALNTAKRRFSMIHIGNIHDKIQEAQEIRVRADGVFQVKKHDVPDVDISGFLNWETVHGDIRAKLINAE